jgi:hypothetical protein
MDFFGTRAILSTPQTPHKCFFIAKIYSEVIEHMYEVGLVVLSVGLTLCIKDTSPVTSFEVGLSIDIDLHLNLTTAGLDREGWDANRIEESSEKLSDSTWAPWSNNFSSLQGELGSKNWVSDSSIIANLSERKRLVDRRALVSESVDRSLGVDGNADSKSTSNTGSGLSWLRKILERDARNVSELGRKRSLHVELGAGLELWQWYQ